MKFFTSKAPPTFLVSFYPEPTHGVPALIGCVREVVTRSTTRLLTHLVSMVTTWQAQKDQVRGPVPESVQVKIPSEWKYPSLDLERKEADSNSECALKRTFIGFVS